MNPFEPHQHNPLGLHYDFRSGVWRTCQLGHSPVDPRCFLSKSTTRSTPTQQSGGTLAGSAAQALGSNNSVNTGTVTNVDSTSTNTSTTASGNTIGNDSVVTYNTGLDAGAVFALLNDAVGNKLSTATPSALGGAGGGGVTITTTPPISTVKASEWAGVAKEFASKYAIWIGLAVVAGVAAFFLKRKKS